MIGALANFVLETATAPGTGTFTLNGPETGRRSFSAAFKTGQSVFYFADDGSSAEWGLGTLTTGTPNTLSRTTVLGTTSGSAQALNFAGTVEVYNEIPAERVPILDESGHLLLSPVTDWSTQQAVPANGADARFLKLLADPQSVSGIVTFVGDQGKNLRIASAPPSPEAGVGGDVGNTWWIDQYYARKTALAAEAKARTDADALKANLAGGNTFTDGDQVTSGTVVAGSYTNSTRLRVIEPSFGMAGDFKVSRNNSTGVNFLTLAYTDTVGGYHEHQFWTDGSIFSPARNDAVAWRGDVTAEATVRATADALKANLAGGNTFTNGDQITNGTFTAGGYSNTYRLVAYDPAYGMTAVLKASRNNSTGVNFLVLAYNDTVGGYHEHQFGTDGSIFSTTKNDHAAFKADLPVDTVGTYNGYRSLKRTWSSGVIEQWFYTGDLQTINGPVTVPFPQAYAVGVVPVVVGGMPTMSEDGSTSVPNFQNEADEPPTITNTGFTVVNYGANGTHKTCAFFVHVIG